MSIPSDIMATVSGAERSDSPCRPEVSGVKLKSIRSSASWRLAAGARCSDHSEKGGKYENGGYAYFEWLPNTMASDYECLWYRASRHLQAGRYV